MAHARQAGMGPMQDPDVWINKPPAGSPFRSPTNAIAARRDSSSEKYLKNPS
ncbi:MAG: hypothetical protein R3C56_42825 [Pirellulaceae bacterium]